MKERKLGNDLDLNFITNDVEAEPSSSMFKTADLSDVDDSRLELIEPNLLPQSKQGLFGCIDIVSEAGISGWLLDIEESDTPQLITVEVNGFTFAHVYTDKLRKDVSGICGKLVDCGFQFEWGQINQQLAAQLVERLKFAGETITLDFYSQPSSRPIFQHSPAFLTSGMLLTWINEGERLKLFSSARAPAFFVNKSDSHGAKGQNVQTRYKDGNAEKNARNAGGLRVEQVVGNIDALVNGVLCGQISSPILEGKKGHELDVWVDNIQVATVRTRPRHSDTEIDAETQDIFWKIPKKYFDGQIHTINLRDSVGAVNVIANAYEIGPNLFDALLQYEGSAKLTGFIVERSQPSTPQDAQIRIDSREVFDVKCNKNFHKKEKLGFPPAIGGFEFTLPDQFLDGMPHLIEVLLDQKVLRSSYFVFSVQGHVDNVNSDEISGWISDVPASNHQEGFALDVLVNGQLALSGEANNYRDDIGRRCGFHFNISQFTRGKASFVVELRPQGTTKAVLNTPINFFRKDQLIEFIRELAAQSREGKLGFSQINQFAFSRYIAPKLIDELRYEETITSLSGATNLNTSNTPVKVIVPIYDGYDETIRCLTALFSSVALNKTKFEIILVDDHGPNQQLRQLTSKFKDQAGVHLIKNEANLGFVKSVNLALKRVSGSDVVLLNADAIVNGNWLDRLYAAAYSSQAIASVTPFSNNATICSYPYIELENSMPNDLTLAEIDDICKTENGGSYISIPSGIGFCMFMRGDAIEDVGLLDEANFGLGYGEENDWCIRALDRGWKHLHACDTFVEHIGGVSFGPDKKSGLVEKNLKVLSNKYPEYSSIIMDFIRANPARLARNAITVKRLETKLRSFERSVLFISHSLGGGIEYFCRDAAARSLKEGTAIIFLQSRGTSEFFLSFGELELHYHSEDYAALTSDLTSLGISRIHINSDVGFEQKIWELPALMNLPFDVTLHDYLFVCPRVNFVLPEGSYCGEPMSEAACNKCVKKNGTFAELDTRYTNLGRDTGQWRRFYENHLANASEIFAPDEDVAVRFSRYFKNLKVIVKPHPFDGVLPTINAPSLVEGEILRVVVLGAIGPHKGFNTLLACARHANDFNLPIHFVIIGFTCNDQALLEFPNVTITGKYESDELPFIFEEQDGHMALFLSPWPETYSYTLSEALKVGLFPAVLPIGAQAARVARLKIGHVFDENADCREINHELIRISFSGRAK